MYFIYDEYKFKNEDTLSTNFISVIRCFYNSVYNLDGEKSQLKLAMS